jgi:hypothetical protein
MAKAPVVSLTRIRETDTYWQAVSATRRFALGGLGFVVLGLALAVLIPLVPAGSAGMVPGIAVIAGLAGAVGACLFAMVNLFVAVSRHWQLRRELDLPRSPFDMRPRSPAVNHLWFTIHRDALTWRKPSQR